MKRVPIVCTALFLLLLHPRPLAAQGCPQNSIWANRLGHAEVFSTAPSRVWEVGTGYDLTTGTLQAALAGDPHELTQGINVEDRYWIVGPASASPIPFQVRVHFSAVAGGGVVFIPNVGTVCTSSRALLVLASETTMSDLVAESQTAPCTSGTVDDNVAIELQKVPGEEFPVSVGISLLTRAARVTTAATISFYGLPPGYSIQSCQGFSGNVVPVARRTWGAIKQLYR